MDACCGGCFPTLPSSRPAGLCAAFGDPHFTTFDGAHTITLQAMTMWLVRSRDVWIQGLSRTDTGNLVGIAVSGPFIGNHTVVLYNHTSVAGDRPGRLTALYDGTPILAGEGDGG